jgi:cold shock protein
MLIAAGARNGPVVSASRCVQGHHRAFYFHRDLSSVGWHDICEMDGKGTARLLTWNGRVPMKERRMQRGRIVRMIRERGFGFIRTEDGQEIFFHHGALPRGVFDSLAEGQELEFELMQDVRGRGTRATNIRIP